MKPDQERVKTLLSQTVTLLCKNGLHYEKELRIQGLLGITIDCESVFIVHFNESLSDFTSDVVSPLLTGAVEGCDEKAEKSRSANILAGKSSSTLCSETDAEKSCSSLDETQKLSPSHESSQLPLENNETPLTLDEDLKTVKTEQNSEDDGEDVVLVESENEQDIGSLASTLFPTPCNESVESRMKRDRRLRQHPQLVFHGNKRRRLALPGPIENESGYDNDGGNYNVKMEPMSSEYLGSSEQNLTYEEGYPEHSWDNSKTVFSQADAVEELTSVPGCSSWDGFDLQARGLTSSGAVPRSNELYHESTGGPASLPLNSLDNIQIRNALVEYVIRPHVFQARRRVEAFRVIWRKNGVHALDSAWNHIQHWRLDCDEIVKAVGEPSCLFFFSAVTGLYNKSKARTLGTYCDIYPAISYYAVLLSESSLSFVDFAAPVRSRFADAETKQILSHTEGFDPDLRYLSAPLFAALKDCSSSFVRDKIERSASALHFSSGKIASSAIAKLVVTKPDLVSAMSQAYSSIMGVAPYLGLQIAF